MSAYRTLPARLEWLVLSFVLLTICQTPLAAQDLRTWKDASGKFEVQARFIRVNGDSVEIEKSDGKRMTVPLSKLSPVDQGYVEGRKAMQGADSENPFKEMSNETPPAGSSTPAAPAAAGNPAGGPVELTVDFQQIADQPIVLGEWNPEMTPQADPTSRIKPVGLRGTTDFWERYAHSTFNLEAKRVAITYHFGQPGKPESTRIELVDLESGKSLANAGGQGKWTALAVHDDGERIVVRNDGKESEGQLGTVRLVGKKIVPIDTWTPYQSMDKAAKEKVVQFAQFINQGRLLTLSQNGNVVIWDFETRQPVRRFSYHGACQPALSNDRKYLAICGGDLFGIVNLDDENQTPSVKSAPGMNYWLNSSFSPSCRRFAAATMGKLMVWDVASGDVLYEGNIPGLPTNGKLLFPDEDYVMINKDKLIEFSTGIKLWRYHGAEPEMVAGNLVFISTGQNSGRILPVDVPHDKALEMLAAAKAQSDLFILKKGAPVRLDVSAVPDQYRDDVSRSLRTNLDRMGFEESEQAPVTLKATISGPTDEAVSYHFAGSFVVKQFKSVLEIQYDDKSIWSSRATNVPGMVSGRDQADIKQQLAKAGASPNIKFFEGTQLPDFLQKPSGDGKNQDQQMLGSSKVGPQGIE